MSNMNEVESMIRARLATESSAADGDVRDLVARSLVVAEQPVMSAHRRWAVRAAVAAAVAGILAIPAVLMDATRTSGPTDTSTTDRPQSAQATTPPGGQTYSEAEFVAAGDRVLSASIRGDVPAAIGYVGSPDGLHLVVRVSADTLDRHGRHALVETYMGVAKMPVDVVVGESPIPLPARTPEDQPTDR